jgi:hypothetical protein
VVEPLPLSLGAHQMDLCNQPEYNNPYLDSTTRIMYRIMKKNDCLPYWYDSLASL